jgi:hypothetical protein
MPVPSRSPVRFFVAGAALVALAACTSASEPEPVAAEPEATADTITVELADFAFVGLPERINVGTRLAVSNVAEAELHELVAFRLAPDDDRSVAELTQLTPDELVGALGEPQAVLIAAPGGPQIDAVGDGTLTEPGRYAIMCFIPTGVEPDVYLEAAAQTAEGPPQVEGGPPHFVQGMFAELVVE